MGHQITYKGRSPTKQRAWAAVVAAMLVVGTLRPQARGPAAGQAGKTSVSEAQGVTPRPGEWPQWRGVERDGRILAPLPREGWPAQVSRQWVGEVGEGYSGPVVAGDRVWVHSRRGGEEVVSCLRLASGGIVWSKAYPAPFQQDDDARAHGRGPYSTPAVSDGRLFTFGVTGVLSVWNAVTGDLLWRREAAKEFRSGFPYFGAAASPLVWGQLCFVHLGGDDRSKADSPATGAMVAMRVADGREEWRWAGDGPALGASPVICAIGGNPQLIFKTRKKIVGIDPRTGKELWQFLFRVSQDNTIVTPLIVGDRLLTSDYDFGIGAWQIRSGGGGWTVQNLWITREASLFMSSPVLVGGILVGFSHFKKGQLFALDWTNGRLLWRGDPRSGEHASLVSWGNQILVFREDGWLDLGEVSRGGFRLLQKYKMGDSICWGHPAVVDNRILVRDGSRLAAYRLSDR